MHQNTKNLPLNGNPAGRVLNSADIPEGILPANTIYVDKGTPWANPFTAGEHGTREECLSLFQIMLSNSPEALQSLDHLKGKDLVVHSNDPTSHAHVLAHLASINYRARLHWADDILGDVEFKLAA